MPIFRLGSASPDIHPEAWIHPQAVVIGQVTVGPESTIWPGAVLRADVGSIEVGARTSVQDNSILHTRPDRDTVIGSDCVVGHGVHIEAAHIGDRVLIASAAVVLAADIESGATVAAGAVVLDGMRVRAGQRAQGIPALLVADTTAPDYVRQGAGYYTQLAKRYRAELTIVE